MKRTKNLSGDKMYVPAELVNDLEKALIDYGYEKVAEEFIVLVKKLSVGIKSKDFEITRK